MKKIYIIFEISYIYQTENAKNNYFCRRIKNSQKSVKMERLRDECTVFKGCAFGILDLL